MTGLPMILIAGWAFTGASLRGMSALLETRSVCLTSSAELVRMTPSFSGGAQAYLSGLADLLDTLDGRVVLTGWSLGGMLAIEAAAAFPEKIAALVLISGTARFLAASDHPGVEPAALRAMKIGLKREPQSVLRSFCEQCAVPHAWRIPQQDEDDPLLRFPSVTARNNLLAGLVYLENADLRGKLPALHIPALVVHGRADKIVPWQAGAQLVRCLPRGKWRIVEDVGHDLPLRLPELVAAEIATFLKDQA